MTQETRAYWDEFAAEYDTYPDHGLLDSDMRSAWKDLLRMSLPTTASTVADIACGTGTLSVLAAELGHRVHAIDLSGEMVARARAKAAPFGAAVQVSQGDASAPPLAPASVDVVLARHILWTLPDPHGTLARWADLLRPGGRMVLVEGVWGLEPAEDRPELPWGSGVASAGLVEVVRGLGGEPAVVPLSDAVFWGKETDQERYLVMASFARTAEA